MPSKNRNFKSDNDLVIALRNPPKKLCVVGQLITDHPNGDAIAEAVGNPKWSAQQLAVVIRKVQPISTGVITSHRNGQCTCE